MSATLFVEVDPGPLERTRADVVVAPLFSGERPLRGSSGRADWRLCGRLSELVENGRLEGAPGEAALFSSFGGLRSPLLVVLGAGARADFDARTLASLVEDGVARGLKLGAASIALPLDEGLGDASGLQHRAETMVEQAARALASARGDPLSAPGNPIPAPCDLVLRMVVTEEDVVRTSEYLRAVRLERVPSSVTVRMPPATGVARQVRGISRNSRPLPRSGTQPVK